jgi:hypothetical protein
VTFVEVAIWKNNPSAQFQLMRKQAVTLDNLRVPFVINGRFKILSFRSKDPIFKTDPGVIPPEEVRKKAGIDVIQTDFRHNDMRDTGPDEARESIQGVLDKLSKTKLLLSQSNQKR